MEMQPLEGQGNSNNAEPPAGILEEVVTENYYRDLLKAAFKGDWDSAKSFFENDRVPKTTIITSRSKTVLHIAALNAQDQFVEELARLLTPEDLEQVDYGGHTALHNAVLCGRIKMVKVLVSSNSRLTQIQDKEGCIPFNLSAQEAAMHKEIAWFLAQNTTFDGPIDPDHSPHAIQCIVGLTYVGHLDIVRYLLEKHPSLILKKGPKMNDKSILGMLARMPSHFRSGTKLSVLETLIYKCIPVEVDNRPTDANSRDMQSSINPTLQCLTRSLWNVVKIAVPSINRIHGVKLRHELAVELVEKVCVALSEKNPTDITQFFQDRDLLAQAAIGGISELVKLSIRYFPELMWISDDDGSTLMTRAVQYRHDGIIRIFLKESSTNGSSLVPAPTMKESKMMMVVASKYYPDFNYVTNVSGAAFHMQRELQWFKAVESWVAPDFKTIRSGSDGKTYWENFVDNHEKLLENSQNWVKDTADKCMLVSTLIATVLFAAAFSVPGSNNDSNITSLKGPVLVFTIFDGLGLFSSVAATLLFLAILTSPNEPLDFLDSLPKKIIIGLSSLFLSLVFMLVAFAAALTIVLNKTLGWVVIPITLLASFPLTLFAVLHHPLLSQMIISTYGPDIFCCEGIWK